MTVLSESDQAEFDAAQVRAAGLLHQTGGTLQPLGEFLPLWQAAREQTRQAR